MLKMTCVCGCGWSSDQPQAACRNCGQAICPQCGMHTLAVAAWPGESQRVLMGRAQAHVRDMLEEAGAVLELADDAEDGAAHRH